MSATKLTCSSVRCGSALGSCGTPKKNLFRSASRPKQQMDRFIPSRSGTGIEAANLFKENDARELPSPSKSEYMRRLAEDLDVGGARVLAFKSKAPAPPKGFQADLQGIFSGNVAPRPTKKTSRSLPQVPDRILDAPSIVDDYYLNLLDWGSNNVVAIALSSTVYLWNASDGSIEELMTCTSEDDYITSVSWADDGKHVAIGTSAAQVQIWDANRAKQLRSLNGHSARVGALSWNKSILSSGGRDSIVINHDVRVRNHIKDTLKGHEQEICGLKWSPNGQQLASGGNDNILNIWNEGSDRPLHHISAHQAAVKALAWCPWSANTLASGGGTADRCIKFWNTHTGAELNCIDTGSQVCALQWNKHEREILSSHGFSQNQLCLWKYPTMAKVAEFTGHTARVLHLAQSPDGSTVCSAAADETLRFWRCFGDPAPVQKAKPASMSNSMMRSVNIR